MKQLSNKLLYPLSLLSSTLLIYTFFAGRFRFAFTTTIYNYFSYLAEAFLHGSLAFISSPPFLHDLISFGGKIYIYWGPAPVFLILPFVFLFGKEISDALYTAIIASFNPLILYLILSQIEKLKLIKTSNFQKIILCAFFAFGTVHFYLSIFGTVWFTSQIISIFYLLIGLLCITKFSLSKNLITLALSALFFSLAVNSRTTLIFYLPLFVFFGTAYLKNKFPRNLLISLLVFFIIGAIIFFFSAYYNYLRFGSFFENGYKFQNYGAHFSEDKSRYGFFNISYIPKNFYYMFINLPSFNSKPPFLSFDTEGNSVLFTSPLLLLVISLIKKRYWQDTRLKLFNSSSLFGIFLIILFLLIFWGTGWVQFGYRYLLDATPFLILLLAEVINELPAILVMTFLIISILFNILGTLWFLYL